MFNIAEKTTAKKARVKGIDIGGKTGTTKEFEEGCPECGYAVGKHGNNGSLFGFFSSNKSGNSNVFSGLSSLFGKNKRNNSRKTSSSDSLPIWVYVVVIGILIAVIVCLYSCL